MDGITNHFLAKKMHDMQDFAYTISKIFQG